MDSQIQASQHHTNNVNNNNSVLKTPAPVSASGENRTFTFEETGVKNQPRNEDGSTPSSYTLNSPGMLKSGSGDKLTPKIVTPSKYSGSSSYENKTGGIQEDKFSEAQSSAQASSWAPKGESKSPLPELRMPEIPDGKYVTSASGWPTPTELPWTIPGRSSSAIDEFWKEVPPPPHSTLSYPAMSDMSHYQSHMTGVENPYPGMNQLYTPPPPGMSYGSNLQHWRETGFPLGGGGYWRRNTAPMTESGMSRDSSRDDLTSMGEQIFDYEDRFRVDRRKLELMIIGRFDPIKENASEFFQRIGDETNTTVIWPSRIKIGAKSKKDPHIRVGGTSDECVRRAKALIMEYLDTKTSRVTMKMDVSYTDHSHVIGKGGNTIRRVMAETCCHIHFPDSNRSNPNEKSNQVSIAGEMEGVEKARARVRELTPLIFCFDLPIIPSFEPAPDPNDPCVRAIQEQYNIQVTFRQKQKNFHTTIVVVKGCEWEASRVKEATLLLIEHFCCNNPHFTGSAMVGSVGSGSSNGGSNSASSVTVSMNMEISPIHHSVVLGKGNINLKIIMQRTKTTILFPDASDPNIPPIRKGSVTISGNINNVYMARQMLVGSLPLVMMFDLPDHLEIDDQEVQKIQDELDVGISIKPKQRQSNKSVMIKAQERNASGMYTARHKILGLDGEPIKAYIPETYKLQAASAQFINSLADLQLNQHQRSTASMACNPMAPGYPPYQNINPYVLQNLANQQAAGAGLAGLSGLAGMIPSPLATNQQLQNYLFSPGLNSLYGAQQQQVKPMNLPCYDQLANLQQILPGAIPPANNWIAAQAQAAMFNNVLPANHPFLQDYAYRVLNHITHLQQMEQQQQQAKNESAKVLLDSLNNNNYLPAEGSPPMKGSSPRNSSPVHENVGNLTNQLGKLDLTESDKFYDLNQNSGTGNAGMLRSSLSSSAGSGSSSSGGSTGQLHQSHKSSGSVSSPTCSSFSESCLINNNNNNVSKIGQQGADLGEMFLDKLPGDRRAPGFEMKMFAVQSQMDYDQKKLLATKAIQTKPAGEPRTPTPSWSGLGFSNSMPESVIRENLEMSDLDNTSAGNAAGKRQNLAMFPSLMNVREETDEELAKSNEKFSPNVTSSQPTSAEGVTTPTAGSGNQQHFFRPGWFGNSSAFDVMLNPNSLESDVHNRILPSDDLPSLFARQGLAKYTDVFLRHEVDLATFATLTEQDLKEIGIQTFGARKKLLLLANKVKQAGSHRW